MLNLKTTRPERVVEYQKTANQYILASSITVLATKLAEADSPINTKEINLFHKILPLPELGLDYQKLFLDACRDKLSAYHHADKIRRNLDGDTEFAEKLLVGLFKFADCDTYINLKEIQMLYEISAWLETEDAVFEGVLQEMLIPTGNVCKILSLPENFTLPTLKQALSTESQKYNINSPEIQPIPKLRETLNLRTAAINEAYKMLRKKVE